MKFKYILILFYSLIISNLANGQCVISDSIYYIFTTGSTTITAFPGFSWLPRTNINALSTNLYTEGRSSNPKLASVSTSIYASAPLKSNIFFGGDDNSNGHANTQILSKKTFSLKDGPITVRGTFFNRSGDPLYNESYIGIMPANYTYYSPLDNDLGGLANRQGIATGYVATSNNAILLDHGTTTDLTKTIKGPINAIMKPAGKWYTIESTFQLIGTDLYLISSYYNDGGGNQQPLGAMVKIGNTSTMDWLDNLVVFMGIDDMASDLTIIKRTCKTKQCRIEDSTVFDMIKTNFTRTSIPSVSNIRGTDFNSITTPLAIEGVAINDSFYSNANIAYTPAGNRTNIFFGGDKFSPQAQHSASITTKKTYNILDGPLTIEADFFNRSDDPLYNESYIVIVPKNYTWYNGWLTGSINSFEGIRIGARPYATLIVDAKDQNTPDNIIKPLTTHNYAANGKWYKLLVTFDTLNNNLIISDIKTDGGNGYKNIYTTPIIIGDLSNFPWINECRAQVLVDDLIDTLRIIKKNCYSSKCIITHNQNINYCNSITSKSILELFNINNLPIKDSDGSFRLVAFNNQYFHVNLDQYPLNGSKLSLNRPEGRWRIKFTSNCGSADSIDITILPKPLVYLKKEKKLCENKLPFNPDQWIDSLTPLNTEWHWQGKNYFSSQIHSLNLPDSIWIYGNTLSLALKSNNGCTDTIKTVNYTLQRMPIISINNKNSLFCKTQYAELKSSTKYTNGIIWIKNTDADGQFNSLYASQTDYYPGNNDTSRGISKIFLQSIPPIPNICPNATDSTLLKWRNPPKIRIKDSVKNCIPFSSVFTAQEISGIPVHDILFTWLINNQQESLHLPSISKTFTAQGIFDLSLTTIDTLSKCTTYNQFNKYIYAYPKPNVMFTTEPDEWTMINNPVFKTQNKSSIDASLFKNNLSFNWTFENRKLRLISNDQNPEFKGYKDTAIYRLKLVVSSQYGCKDSSDKLLRVISKLQYWVPSAFTPDNGGAEINNRFYVFASNYRSAWIRIYNRWGEKLYESTSLDEGWDGRFMGKPCMDGVYVVVADIRGFDGYHNLYKSTFHLLR